MDNHEKAVFFRSGIFSDVGIIWEFTYCTIIGEVGLLNEDDVYVVLIYRSLSSACFDQRPLKLNWRIFSKCVGYVMGV